MDFKIDENLPIETADLLVKSGHDAVTVNAQQLGGNPDDKIASVCQQENRIFITIDNDFADIRTYPPSQYPGLIVLRLRRQDKLAVLNAVGSLIPRLIDEPISNRLWIVEENRLRIRD